MHDIYKPITKTKFGDLSGYYGSIIIESFTLAWKKTGAKKLCLLSIVVFIFVTFYKYYESKIQEATDMLVSAGVMAVVVFFSFLAVFFWQLICIPVTHYRLIVQSKVIEEFLGELKRYIKLGKIIMESDNLEGKEEWVKNVNDCIIKNLPASYSDVFYGVDDYRADMMASSFALSKRISPADDRVTFFKYVIALQHIVEELRPYTIHGVK